jgi:pilus assembly protein CpaC
LIQVKIAISNTILAEVHLKVRAIYTGAFAIVAILATAGNAKAQGIAVAAQSDAITHVDLPVGRAYPLTTPVAITKVSITDSDIADVLVIGPREMVINAKKAGETDALLWFTNGVRQHFRVSVHSPSDRQQIALYIKMAEVRRDFLQTTGLSLLYRNRGTRVGSGTFNTDNPFNQTTGAITLPSTAGFGTVLTDFGTQQLLALLDAEESKGRAKTLAEPNLLAGNKDSASFLAGGEVPIPIIQGTTAGSQGQVSIQYKEFGVRLHFTAEILSDSLVKLQVMPEVSSLDFTNGITISGFRIPAFLTRRISTTVDVPRDQSMIISGLFSNTTEKTKSGIPYLMDIPVLGQLFSSTRWQNGETELLVVVTPVVVDPKDPRPQDMIRLLPDTALPARDAIKHKMEPQSRPPSPIIR